MATSFNKLCSNAHYTLPTAANRAQFLSDGGVHVPANITQKATTELCATLLWARQSLAAGTDPDTWPTALPPILLASLHALYVLPPLRATAPAASIDRRVADMVLLYDPGVSAPGVPAPAAPPQQPPAQSAAPAAPLGAASTINIVRPGGLAAPPASGAPAASQAGPSTAGASITPSNHRKRHLLLHRKLGELLPPAVYTALDASSQMSFRDRAKYQTSCEDEGLVALLDLATAAPFHHLSELALHDGAHFDPQVRGKVLAGAGRSAAPLAPSSAHYADGINRDSHLRTLAASWRDILPSFALDHELSSSSVNTLWDGVSYILSFRAARASEWGVPEVFEACKKQLADSQLYRSQVASVLARAAAAYVGVESARFVNKSYLQFFLPFWWEHILLRGILDGSDLKDQLNAILKPSPAPVVPPTPLPALPPPPAYTPPPPPLPPHFPPPHAFLPPAAYGPPPGAYPHPYPGVPPLPLPTPTLPPPTQRAPHSGFLGKPASPLICGANYGFAVTDPNARTCTCSVARAYPGKPHYLFECPYKYHAQRGSCPGWTATGTRIPAAWNGDDITTATAAEWRAMAAGLPLARVVGGRAVTF